MDTKVQSHATFQDAEREYREAWANPAHTRFEFPPVDVNKTVREHYRATPPKRLTRASLWDMETKKAWNAMSYLNYVANEAHSWGRHTLSDGAERWCRASMQRGWISLTTTARCWRTSSSAMPSRRSTSSAARA